LPICDVSGKKRADDAAYPDQGLPWDAITRHGQMGSDGTRLGKAPAFSG